MSAFTDRLYAAWTRQNAPDGGMGAVAPMTALRRRANHVGRVPAPSLAAVPAARPDQQGDRVHAKNAKADLVVVGATQRG